MAWDRTLSAALPVLGAGPGVKLQRAELMQHGSSSLQQRGVGGEMHMRRVVSGHVAIGLEAESPAHGLRGVAINVHDRLFVEIHQAVVAPTIRRASQLKHISSKFSQTHNAGR